MDHAAAILLSLSTHALPSKLVLFYGVECNAGQHCIAPMCISDLVRPLFGDDLHANLNCNKSEKQDWVWRYSSTMMLHPMLTAALFG